MDRQTEGVLPTQADVQSDSLDTLWELHNSRPVPPETWSRVIARAQWEDAKNYRLGQYQDIPLHALLELAEKAKAEPSSIERYRLLTKPSPNGALWFDTLHGLTSPEVINTIGYFINQVRWGRGLDLGTGTGILARKITRHCGTVTALDQSEALLHIAKARHGLVRGGKFKITEVAADVMHLPLPQQCASLAVSSGLTAWLEAPQLDAFVCELRRVLTPGGWYVSAIPTSAGNGPANAKAILADMIVDVINGSHKKTQEKIVSLPTFVQTFARHGFEPFVKNLPQYGAAVTSFQKPQGQ